MADTAIFDVDGTLVDTNYQHALAWFRAFRRIDLTVPVWRVHRAIGMGGDKLVAAVTDDGVERDHGDELREMWSEEFARLIDEVQPFEAAHDLLAEVKRRGFRVVLASSGQRDQVERFVDLVDGRDIAEAWTTADDVEASKPEPDLVAAALEKVSGASGIMIGDSTWDVIAASKLEIPTLAVLTGGFSADELEDAGAVRVFDSLRELLGKIDATGLARPE